MDGGDKPYRDKKKKVLYNKKQAKEEHMKQPIILVREHSNSTGGESSEISQNSQLTPNKIPSVILKTRDHDSRSVSPNINHKESNEDGSSKLSSSLSNSHPIYQIVSKPNPVAVAEAIAPTLLAPPLMLSPIKLLDETLTACDGPLDYLMDQTDFLVVGIMGSQCAGKSYVLSELAGSPGIFRSDAKEIRSVGGHCTVGVDMFVTQSRVIFLDTQPLFSGAIMDCMAGVNEKKFSSDVTLVENSAELTDLHLIAFLLSVCHIVVCVEDRTLNIDTLRYLRNAEMLKPSTATTSVNDLIVEYFPTVVMVKNNATASEFTASAMDQLQMIMAECFYDTQLKVDNGVCLSNGKIIPYLKPNPEHSNYNIFLLPINDAQCNEIKFNGHIGFDNLVTALRHQILSTPRQSITSMPISEKHWYHYSAKVMENIKKGNFFMEYNRLLT